jgi:hypothetical protein
MPVIGVAPTVDGIVTAPTALPVKPVITPAVSKNVMFATGTIGISGVVVGGTRLLRAKICVCKAIGVIAGPMILVGIILLKFVFPIPLFILVTTPSKKSCCCIIKFE